MKRNKFLFGLALCAMVLFVNMLSAQFAGGNGTEEEPYLVETATQLNNVRNYIGSYFLQIDDIDLTGYNWVPIGVLPTPYGDQPFYGRYDGNNYLIENLTISNPNHDYVGLFGYSIDAELKNIRLSQVDIDAGSASCVGAITGIAINSFVSNCSVVSGSIEGDNLVGGLVGGMGTLFPYYANKKLSDEGSKKANKKFDVYSYFDGMIDQLLANFVGFNSKSYYDFPVSNITNSSADGLTVEGSISVGGILGYQLYSDVKVCYAQNEVIGEEEVGGLIGFMEGSQAFQTYSRSSVEAEGDLGGLVGKMTGSLIGNSYSTGLVTETQPTLYRGGLIGNKDLNSSVNDSYWDKETSGILISAGGVGKTTSEMTSYPYGMGTYTEWNFFNVWLPDEVPGYLPNGVFPINDGYPILVNLISRSTMDDFFEGDGTDLLPYEVSTWYHLSLIRNPIMLDKSFVLTDDINLSGIPYNYLYDWLPIGCASYPFTGSLDGNGYVISNLQGVSGTSENSGLFGVVKNAKFVDVSLDSFTVSGQENVGTLAGLLIDTYTKDASVSNSAVSGYKNIGGLYGKVERKNVFTDNSAINGVTIENTSVTGSNSDKENIGGVIGYCSIDESNPNYNYNPIYIRLNDIVVDDVTVKGTKNVGGAIGYAYNAYIIGNGTLDHSISASSIEIEGHENVGGVIGYYQTRSRNLPSSPSLGVTLADISVNDASIEATSATNVGGAIGHVNNADIDNCVITGLSIEVDNSENIGGLIGYLFGSKATSCSARDGIVGGASESIGGLVGTLCSEAVVEKSYTNIVVKGIENVGGLLGNVMDSDIKNCYARGEVIGLNNAASNIGGLIGNMTGASSISYCYATGKIEYEPSASHIGGLVGYAEFSCSTSFCYWDRKTSGVTISAVGMIKDTNQMVGAELGFGRPWYIDQYFICNDGYPILSPSPTVSFAGNGSENSPWLIESAEQLNYLRAYIGVVGAQKYFKLTTNIDLGVFPWNVNQGWLPIGTEDNPFKGKLDGNGKRIDNLFINTDIDYVGLFSCMEDTEIKNIKLINANVKGNDNVGSLAGYSENTDMKNITVRDSQIKGSREVGGVLGYAKNSRLTIGGLLTDMNKISNIKLWGDEAVGGVIGRKELDETGTFSYVEYVVADSIIITNSSSDTNAKFGGVIGSSVANSLDSQKFIFVRDIAVNGVEINGNMHLGGLIGYSYQTILSNIRNTDILPEELNILVTKTEIYGDSNLGGMVGTFIMSEGYPPKNIPLVEPTIYRCQVEDSKIGTSFSKDYIGGLIGYVGNAFIKSCGSTDVIVEGETNIGGLVGEYSEIIKAENCQTSGNFPNGYVQGKENVGGLIGFAHPGGGSIERQITISTSSIDVRSTSHILEGRVGGLVGYSNNILISGCSTNNKIIVSNSYNIGGLVGASVFCTLECSSSNASIDVAFSKYIGGLIGVSDIDEIINYCYSNSAIDASSSSFIGGLIGDLKEGGLSLCYSKGIISLDECGVVGGLIGKIGGGKPGSQRVEQCYSEASIYTDTEGECLGGLIASADDSVVSDSYAIGSIYKSSSISTNNCCGGLIGQIGNTVAVLNTYACGNIDGDSDIGGLVGSINGTSCYINRSYSIGKVEGYHNVGGLVGSMEGSSITVENSFWDTVTSYKNVSLSGDIGGGLMTVDMVRDSSMYVDWDFDNTWAMVDYTTYPYLQWQVKPGVHNYPKHGHHKVYKGKTVYWESFPVMDNDEEDFAEILEPLTDINALSKVYAQNGAERTWQDSYWDDDLAFKKTGGYKLEFVDDEEYELLVPGTGVDYDTTVTLETYPDGNWVGYWIPQPQPISNIFSSIPGIYMVKSENWTISKQGQFGWSYPQNVPLYLEFGKMYIIYTTSQVVDFTWPVPTSPYYPPTGPIVPPTNFAFKDGPDYEVFNIESIENDQDVIEVGVFAGDTCVGASVFTGNYPLQILAYTNASHSEEVISFVVHRSTREEDRNIRTVEVLDPETGDYYEEVLQPQAKRIATLRLGAGEEIEEREEVVKPQFALSQNYPNPILMNQVSRTSELTKIDFSLPEDAEVSLNIYNIKGQIVKSLTSGVLSAGRHTVSWDGNNDNNQRVSSGVYFYRLDNGKKTINRKMLIIK